MDPHSLPSLRSSVLVLCAVVSLTLGWATLTLPSYYAKRVLPVVLLIAVVTFHRQNEFSSNPLLNEMFGRLFLLWISYMPFLVYLKRWDGASHTLHGIQHRHHVPSWQNYKSGLSLRAVRENPNALRQYIRLYWNQRGICSLKMLFNGRGINTDWQVGQLPPPRQAALTPSPPGPSDSSASIRRRFLIRRTIALLMKYLLWCIWQRYGETLIRVGQSDYAPEKHIILRRAFAELFSKAFGTRNPYVSSPVTSREVEVRLWLVFANNVPSILVLKSFHDICALVFVGFGFDTPAEWPPFFGSIREAYTVRGYWSRFWQLLLYRIFTGVASLVLRNVLRIRRRSTVSHLIHTALVFVISGIFHAIVNIYTTQGAAKSPVVCFYALQPLAFAIEGFVQRLWCSLRPQHYKVIPETQVERVLTRVVGYLWVILWFFWSEPKTVFAEHYSIRQYWEHRT